MELHLNFKLNSPITEPNRYRNYLFLNLVKLMVKYTVIAKGAIPQTIIVIIANKASF
jgi:hypothetical protein